MAETGRNSDTPSFRGYASPSPPRRVMPCFQQLYEEYHRFSTVSARSNDINPAGFND